MSTSKEMRSCTSVECVSSYLAGLVSDPALLRGQLLRGSGVVAEFESILALQYGFPFCMATCNATTALIGLGLVFRKSHPDVWVSRDHWAGTASAFQAAGCDVYRFQGTISSKRKKPARGIIVTGDSPIRPAGFEDWIWIEDSPRLPNSTLAAGGFSKADIQVLSFGPGKPICLGEGGAILCRKQHHYRRIVRCTQHPERYFFEFGVMPAVPRIALNARIHPIAAILGIEALMDR